VLGRGVSVGAELREGFDEVFEDELFTIFDPTRGGGVRGNSFFRTLL
jgi:hypothetical protein